MPSVPHPVDRLGSRRHTIVTGLVLPLFAALVAVLPGAFTLWRNRSVARLADDPALPERLLANRTHGGVAYGTCFAILVFTAGNHLAWALPLLIVTRMAAGYPLRRILHRETWGLGAYLSFFLRLMFTTFGFWILLAATPGLVALTGSHDWIVAGGLAVVLFAWSEAYSTVFHAVLRCWIPQSSLKVLGRICATSSCAKSPTCMTPILGS